MYIHKLTTVKKDVIKFTMVRGNQLLLLRYGLGFRCARGAHFQTKVVFGLVYNKAEPLGTKCTLFS